MYHGLVDHWYPIGDNGYFVIRARDVLTRHHPLLGAWSSGSNSLADSVNNLGPLQLDLLAPFAKAGAAAGTVIGVGAVQLASVVGIWATLRRLTNAAVVIVAMVMVTTIEWSMGTALLLETRQHPYLVLPFLCLLVLVWAVASGALWALPWAAFVASLVVQTHLSYLFFFAGLSLWALAALGVHLWARRRDDPSEWPTLRSRARRSAVVTLAVIVICWIQPLIDQLFGEGNIGKVLSADSDAAAPGFGAGTEIVATVVTRPWWWLRPGFREFDPTLDRAGGAYALISLALLAGVLAVAAWATWMRRRTVAFTGVVTGVVALVIGVVSAAQLVLSDFGLNVGNYRWLFSLGPFIVIVLVSAATSVAPVPATANARRIIAGALTSVGLLVAVLALPYSYQGAFVDGAPRIDATHRLLTQLDELDVEGTVLFDRSKATFSEPYTYPILIKLQELGIEFEVVDEADVRRFGDGRKPDGDATVRLSVVVPDNPALVPDGRRVAGLDGLSEQLRHEHDELLGEIASRLRSGEITADVERASAESGRDLRHIRRLLHGRPVRLGRCAHGSSGDDLADDIAVVSRAGAFTAGDNDAGMIERWRRLYEEDCLQTVGVYLSPL